MKKTKFQKVTALCLALVLLLCGGVLPVGASGATGDDGSAAGISEMLNAISYDEYIALYNDPYSRNEKGEILYEGENAVLNENYVPVAGSSISIPGIDATVSGDIDSSKFTKEEWDSMTQAQRDAYAEVRTYKDSKTEKKGLYMPSTGKVTWTLDPTVEKYASLSTAARYYIEIEYYPVANKSTSIERLFEINGEIPFAEARYLTISKVWSHAYPEVSKEISADRRADVENKAKLAGISYTISEQNGKTYINYSIPTAWTQSSANFVNGSNKEEAIRFFIKDIDLNEIRSGMEQTPEWTTYQFKDSNGFHLTPFEFVIAPDEDGLVSLTLEAVNEPIVISEIRLVKPEAQPSYQSYLNSIPADVKKAGSGKMTIEAEYYSSASSQTIYPQSDSTSAASSPSSNAYTVLNTLGGDKWQSPGQWITYKFKVDQSGMYKIATRFRQNLLEGMYSSRILSLYSEGNVAKGQPGYYNGVPFAEATQIRFNYSSDWQSGFLTDGATDFEFYFEAGVTYTMKLEVTLGTMGEIVSRVQNALNSINDDYLSILKLTGATPDEDRDYGFRRVMPEVIRDLIDQKNELYAVADILVQTSGEKSTMSSNLEKVAILLEDMTASDDNVAKSMESLKSYIGTLGTWISDAKTQPLTLDYLVIQPSNDDTLPRAQAGFFESLWFEITSFFQSFFRNYDRVGAMSDASEGEYQSVEVWLSYGRDQTQVIRNLINNKFTPEEKITVDLKLVAGGTLLPSILAGMGPDANIGVGEDTIINYAIRGALEPIEDMEGSKEAFEAFCKENFNDNAMLVIGIEDNNGVFHYYGLPEMQTFTMMFVRLDILADLQIDVPKTWDDVKAAIPVLQANNMQIGMINSPQTFIYQMGGELFADNGMRINLDSNVSLEAFEMVCDMYTMYSFPYSYNFANRFRTGEMPIGFADYTGTYNHLKVFATEIEGLWEFRPMPGMLQEDGSINYLSQSSVTAISMIRGCEDKASTWKFMKWYTGAECQRDYSNEMVAILGPSAKHPTANKIALESLPWTTAEYKQVWDQFNNLAAIPNYPGNYIIGRYTNFAFLAAYNDGADPVAEMQSYINIINKEITRKRAEVELETLDYVGQTLAEKRMKQATEAIEALNYGNEYAVACQNALDLMKGYTTEDYASLRAMADTLESLNASTFAKVIGFMRDAADALESYEAYK